jgi:hypothetical protein
VAVAGGGNDRQRAPTLGSHVDRTDSAQSPVEARAAKESATMSKADLLAEPGYSLKISIGPTDAWMAQRVKDW